MDFESSYQVSSKTDVQVFNPIPLLLKNNLKQQVSVILAPSFILLCEILVL